MLTAASVSRTSWTCNGDDLAYIHLHTSPRLRKGCLSTPQSARFKRQASEGGPADVRCRHTSRGPAPRRSVLRHPQPQAVLALVSPMRLTTSWSEHRPGRTVTEDPPPSCRTSRKRRTCHSPHVAGRSLLHVGLPLGPPRPPREGSRPPARGPPRTAGAVRARWR